MSKDTLSRLCRGLDEQVTVFGERPWPAPTRSWVGRQGETVREAGGWPQGPGDRDGARATGPRELVGIDLGEADTEAFWHSFPRSLRARGLDGSS